MILFEFSINHKILQIAFFDIEPFFQDVNKIKEIFGNDIRIKLDLHHCDHRVTRTLDDRMENWEKDNFKKDIMLMTRKIYDWGKVRTQATASPEEILTNINEIIKYWKRKIPPATLDALEKTKTHAAKVYFLYPFLLKQVFKITLFFDQMYKIFGF